MKTMHGAEIYAAFEKAGGTKEQWVEHIVPMLRKAGSGPLYTLSQGTLDFILSFARRRIPCRCGCDVRDCKRGCVLFACCGGYTTEGHMTDCPGAVETKVCGKW